MTESQFGYLCSHDHLKDERDDPKDQPIQYIMHIDYKARQHIKPINYCFY